VKHVGDTVSDTIHSLICCMMVISCSMPKYLVNVRQFTVNEISLSFLFIYIYWQHVVFNV